MGLREKIIEVYETNWGEPIELTYTARIPVKGEDGQILYNADNEPIFVEEELPLETKHFWNPGEVRRFAWLHMKERQVSLSADHIAALVECSTARARKELRYLADEGIVREYQRTSGMRQNPWWWSGAWHYGRTGREKNCVWGQGLPVYASQLHNPNDRSRLLYLFSRAELQTGPLIELCKAVQAECKEMVSEKNMTTKSTEKQLAEELHRVVRSDVKLYSRASQVHDQNRFGENQITFTVTQSQAERLLRALRRAGRA